MRTFDRLVSDYMTTPVHTISVDDDLSSAHARLDLFRVSCLVAVGRDGVAAGVLSRTDLLRAGRLIARATGGRSALQLPSMCVGDLMTRDTVSIAAGATVADAGRLMVERHIHRLFVLDSGRPSGVFSTKESMRAVAEERIADPIGAVMSKPVLSVQATDPVATAINRLDQSRVSGLVVLDSGAPAGLFSQIEALAARDLAPQTAVEEVMSFSLLTLPVATPLFRAAAFAASARARRLLALDGPAVAGILTGLDFAKATAR
jgi:CBS domain-containing protein